MSSSVTHRSFSLSLPRDYIRRRRVIRRITMILVVALLGIAVSYVIVHYSAGAGAFTVPHP
jgi:uncharacterized membrane protein YwzB